MRVLVAALGLMVLAAGCAVRAVDPATLLPVSPAAVVRIGDAAAAALATHGRVEVWVARREGGQPVANPITASAATPPLLDRVLLVSYGGETGEAWNTFVYGTAEPGTARVELLSFEGVGGQVVDGAWLVVLRERDVGPDELHWRFHAADGSVRREGSGLRSCSDVAPCGPLEEAVPPAAVVRLDGTAAAAVIRGGLVQVWFARRESDEERIDPILVADAIPPLVDRVLMASGRETGHEGLTFVYGTAEPGTARVELLGFEGVGGQVV
ncbi:MAG TPA: hypothetical protein VNO86_05725, partial [Candidatus Binatia bacterium]|nr:hypothetical protein [Candidatus Binatia bacterium]